MPFEEGEDAGTAGHRTPTQVLDRTPATHGYHATGVQIASGYRQHPFVCPAEPERPHIELMT
ncbi:hypothetical protein ACFYRN_41170 [Streptomyces sp. NPDC005227]|uniref:hypothetical protein n=1 Tax=Streptomyces sp. NPDC005227 TaxID=3364707 RepID=UPI003698A43E